MAIPPPFDEATASTLAAVERLMRRSQTAMSTP